MSSIKIGFEVEFFELKEDKIKEAGEIFKINPTIEKHEEHIIDENYKYYEIQTLPLPIKKIDSEIKEKYTQFVEILKKCKIFSIHINYSNGKEFSKKEVLLNSLFGPEYLSLYSSKRIFNEWLSWPIEEPYQYTLVGIRLPPKKRKEICLEMRYPCYSKINPLDILEYTLKNKDNFKEEYFYLSDFELSKITNHISGIYIDEGVGRNICWWLWMGDWEIYKKIRPDSADYLSNNKEEFLDNLQYHKEKFLDEYLEKGANYLEVYAERDAIIEINQKIAKETWKEVKEIIYA